MARSVIDRNLFAGLVLLKTMTSSPTRVIDLSEGAPSMALLTRDQGKALCQRILEILRDDGHVMLDLSAVEGLSPSFADELFGGLETRLGARFRERVRISCPKREWKSLIASVLSDLTPPRPPCDPLGADARPDGASRSFVILCAGPITFLTGGPQPWDL